MALLKKCNHCSEKGLFLKLTNGLCDNCKVKIEDLEANYTKLLQNIALNPSNKFTFIEELNTLITKAIPFDGISNISVETYKNLLLSLSQSNLIKNEPTVQSNQILSNNNIQDSNKILNLESSNIEAPTDLELLNSNILKPITPNLSIKKTPHNTEENLLKTTSDITNSENILSIPVTKIKNLVEPVLKAPSNSREKNSRAVKTTKTLSLNLNNVSSLKPKQVSTINLDLQSALSKKEIQNKLESTLKTSIDTPSIKDSFILNNLRKKCSMLMAKLDDSNSSLESIAESYFDIKNNFSPHLSKEENIQTTLETTKNILCIRSKKSESELFDFFNYVTIFIQTTGLSPVNSDIIEISALKISYGKIIDEFYTLVNPIKSIKLSVTNTTGISNEDVENKPTIDLVIPTLMKFIGDYQLVGFNAKPVELFINSTLKKLNMPLIPKSSLSTISLYRIRYKNFHGQPPALSDITNTCLDLLPSNDIEIINSFNSFSISSSHAIFKIYEILKYRYK